MHQLIHEWARNRGYGVAWADPGVLDDVKGDLDGRHTRGELDEVFYSNALGNQFASGGTGSANEVQSVLLLSIPRPLHVLRFETETGVVDAMVPPTYVNHRLLPEEIRAEIQNLMGSRMRVELMKAPHKAVAARAGLAVYGRNNITYTVKTGSFHQIVGYLTDHDPSKGGGPTLTRQEPRMMDRCRNCRICRNACPTGAIAGDRFLLHAERCITFLNEYHLPWPKMPRTVHNCLVGCMTCQMCCPENEDRLDKLQLPQTFSVEETRALLENGEIAAAVVAGHESGSERRTGPVWDGIRAKFASAGLDGLDDVAGRNLRALIDAQAVKPER